MKNKINSAFGLLVMGGLAMGACTDVESVDITRTTPQEQNPEAYASYVASLNAYKAADHKLVYAWFDNSVKTPASPAQHITNVPDSVDVISLMTPGELADFERTDMETVRQKGTKVVYTISIDDIQTAYDDMVADAEEAGTTLSTDFNSYLTTELNSQLALSDNYDGLILRYTGQNYRFMATADRTAYEATQTLVLNAVSTWKTSNAEKLLAWQGSPQNLVDKTILNSCACIIVESDGATDENSLQLSVDTDMAGITLTGGTKVLVAVSTTAATSSDTKTGYWGTTRALGEVAYWVTADNAAYTKAGIAIYNVQNDYYATGGDYTYVREAINIMNPAPAK